MPMLLFTLSKWALCLCLGRQSLKYFGKKSFKKVSPVRLEKYDLNEDTAMLKYPDMYAEKNRLSLSLYQKNPSSTKT